jgi:hypothetical protein
MRLRYLERVGIVGLAAAVFLILLMGTPSLPQEVSHAPAKPKLVKPAPPRKVTVLHSWTPIRKGGRLNYTTSVQCNGMACYHESLLCSDSQAVRTSACCAKCCLFDVCSDVVCCTET